MSEETGQLTRERLLGPALLAAAAVSLYICYRIVTPFMPALIWAVALAVMAHPVHDWLSRHISPPGAAAFLAVAMVAVALLGALIWLSNEVIAIVGGLFVYGAPGLIVGPAALAVTLALLDILRRRTAHGKPAELPT